MYIIFEYITCMGLTLIAGALLFVFSAAFLIAREEALRLAAIVRALLSPPGLRGHIPIPKPRLHHTA
jgi:membrane-anchored protein YejM (alkaline phosphatase superfamily)